MRRDPSLQANRSNHAIELIASGRYILLFGSLNPYHVAMRLLARAVAHLFLVRSMTARDYDQYPAAVFNRKPRL